MENMIPKVIHYCWFGGNEFPDIIKKCMASWKEKCPDYEIIEWNESNFDVNFCEFTKKAYEEKKWAFVSDVARLWIIYNNGGIYLDTDVELKTTLDGLLDNEAWFASDSSISMATGLGFGAVKGNDILKAILDDYLDRDELITCTSINTNVLRKELPGLEYFKNTQKINGITVLNSDDYSLYARHIYTSTYLTGKAKKQNQKKHNEPKWLKVFKWKMFCKMQTPRMLKYCDTHNNLITKLYMFFVFDFWYGGFRRIGQVIAGKLKKTK